MKSNNSKCDSIGHFFDNLMWYLIYLLPLILVVISYCRGSVVPLSDMFNSIGLNIVNDNILLTSFINVFGVGGVFPIFTTNDFLIYATYFILVFLVHLAIDCILFVFRAFHRIVNHGFGGASHE